MTYVSEAIDQWKKRSCTSVKRRERVKKLCFKLSQSNSFPEEVKALGKSNLIPKNSHISCLNPILIEGLLLYAEGRLTKLSIPNFSLHPIKLDGKDLILRLIVKQYHEKLYLHGGHETVLNGLRQKFWILGSRQCLRSIVSK